MTTTDADPATLLSIAEAAQHLGLSTSALRYYETEGLLRDPVARTTAGRRRYDAGDLRWIGMLQRLRATGMPIREVREYAALCRAGGGNEAQCLRLLREHRGRVLAQLDEVHRHLGAITAKIEGCEGALARSGSA